MAARTVYQASSLGESTSSTTTYATKTSITINSPPASSLWLVLWSCEGGSNSGSAPWNIRLHDGTTELCLSRQRCDNATNDYFPIQGMYLWSAGGSPPGSKTFNLEYARHSGSITMKIRQARIMAFNLGSLDQNASSDGVTNGTSTSYADKTTLTFTPPSTGDYLLLAYAELGPNTNATFTQFANLLIDGSEQAFFSVSTPSQTGLLVPGMMVFKENLANSSRTIKIQFKGGTTSSMTIQRARLVALRCDDLPAVYYSEVTADSSISNTSLANYATLTQTPAAVEHIWITTGASLMASTTNRTLQAFDDSTTTFMSGDRRPSNTTATLPAGCCVYVDEPGTSQTYRFRDAVSAGSMTQDWATITGLQLESSAVTVNSDAVIPYAWMGGIKQDAVSPFEFRGGAKSDAVMPLELRGAVNSDAAARLEWLATIGGGAVNTETWTGADSDPWPSANWNAVQGSAGTKSATIQGNRGQIALTGGGYVNAGVRSKFPSANDFDVDVLLFDLRTTGEEWASIIVRAQGTWTEGWPANGYILEAGPDGTKVYKVVGGTPTEVEAYATLAGEASRRYRFQVIGDTIKWGGTTGAAVTVWEDTIVDTDVTGSGTFGLALFGGSTNTDYSIAWDNLSVTYQTATTAFPLEWRGGARADAVSPIEYRATLNVNGLAPVEYLGSVRADAAPIVEWRGGARQDAVVLLAWLATIQSNGVVPVEYIGAVQSSGVAPIEWRGGARQDATLLTEALASLYTDAAPIIEWRGGVRSDAVIPVEWAGALTVTADALLLIEWLTTIVANGAVPVEWLSSLRTDAQVPYEWRGGVVGNAILPLEWRGGVNADAVLGLAWVSSLNADYTTPIEYKASLFSDGTFIDEWRGGTQQAASALLEWRGGVRSDGIIPMEWGGALVVESDALLLLEWRATLVVDTIVMPEWKGQINVNAGIPIEATASLFSNGTALLAWLASINVDHVVPITWVGGVDAPAALNVAWLGSVRSDGPMLSEWGSSLFTNAQIPIAFGGGVAQDALIAVEWKGTIAVDGVVPIEVVAVVLGDAASIPIEYGTQVFLDTTLLIQWIERAVSDAVIPVEWLGPDAVFAPGNERVFVVNARGTTFTVPARGVVFTATPKHKTTFQEDTRSSTFRASPRGTKFTGSKH